MRDFKCACSDFFSFCFKTLMLQKKITENWNYKVLLLVTITFLI